MAQPTDGYYTSARTQVNSPQSPIMLLHEEAWLGTQDRVYPFYNSPLGAWCGYFLHSCH